MRFPTLEVFAAEHGSAFASEGWPLTPRQRELAEPIFGASLRYDEIRIVIAPIVNSPTTLGSIVRVALPAKVDQPLIPDHVLIHELTHVWQFQTRGMSYLSNSLCKQFAAFITTGSRSGAYTLTQSEVVKAGSIDRLSAEKQATIVEYWFAGDSFDLEAGKTTGQPTPVRDEPVSASMLEEVRAARPLPKSLILEEAAWGPGMGSRRILDSGRPLSPEIPLLRIEF